LQLNFSRTLAISRHLPTLGSDIDSRRREPMWGMDPEVWKQFEHIREMVRLSQQSPVKERPLVFVEEFGSLLVVREWPGGNITAFTASKEPAGPD
jgi:hypothetical protein